MFWRKREKKKPRLYNVFHEKKVVDSVEKIHLPKRFRDKLAINQGCVVDVALYEGCDEIRIKRSTRKYS